MQCISIIKAEIKSMSPLFISDGEDLLLDQDMKMAYIPATTIAGSFRNYLDFLGEDTDILFGSSNDTHLKSSIYIKDAYGPYTGLEKRDGVKINKYTGASEERSKIERLYVKKGLKFTLNFKIKTNTQCMDNKKNLLYKALNGLNNSFIRFGGNKSNGLGVFKVENIEEIDFDFEDKSQWIKYINRDYKNTADVTQKVLNKFGEENFVKFKLRGRLISPVLIGTSENLDIEDVDDKNIKSDGEYIIPGSSFKGILRHRIEKIGTYFDNEKLAKEIFGNLEDENTISSLWVNESIIDTRDTEDTVYNRIKIDKFTGGTRKTGLFDEMPVQGDIEFNLVYRLKDNNKKDLYAIGIIALALRDLASEDISLGSGYSIGRGRYRGSNLTILRGDQKIEVDFENKTINNKELLDKYVQAVESFKWEEGEDGK